MQKDPTNTLTIDNFTFLRQQIYKAPEDVVRHAKEGKWPCRRSTTPEDAANKAKSKTMPTLLKPGGSVITIDSDSNGSEGATFTAIKRTARKKTGGKIHGIYTDPLTGEMRRGPPPPRYHC